MINYKKYILGVISLLVLVPFAGCADNSEFETPNEQLEIDRDIDLDGDNETEMNRDRNLDGSVETEIETEQ